MMFSVLSWSLFPLVSAWGIDQLSVFDYILWTYVVGLAASCLILVAIPKRARASLPQVRHIDRRLFAEIFIGCLTVLLSFACLLSSFKYLSRTSATVVYEIWPIIAMYITPVLIRKRWEKIVTKDLVFSLLSFIGIAFLLYPEKQDPFVNGEVVWRDLWRLFLPLLGGIFMAVASVMKSRVSRTMNNKNHPIGSLLKVQIFFSFGVVLLSIPFALFWPDKPSVYTADNIMAILFIGVFIHTLGNVTYTMAVLKSRKSNIVILWYLMPIFAVVWLWMAGLGDITSYVILGTVCIITSNLMITVRAERSRAYTSAVMGLLGCGIYAYFVDGLNMTEYYTALSVPIVFYAILVAFSMDRLIKSDKLEENMVIEILNCIEDHVKQIGKANTALYSKHVLGMVTAGDTVHVNMHYKAIRNDDNVYLMSLHNQIDQLALSKLRGTSFSEMFVLFLIGLLTLIASIVYRPNDLIGDGFAIVMALTVIFIFFSVLDLSDKRRRFHLARDEAGMKMIAEDATRNHAGERIISTILILLILAAIIGLLWMKHGYRL